jgi:predicted ATPase/class 3 adenylate cyclase
MTNALGDAVYRESVYQPHCEQIRAAVARHRGYEVGTRGDGFFITFERADDALGCAVAIQEALAKPPITSTDTNGKTWTARVRIGVHTAKRELIPHEEGPRFDYAAGDANFAARVQSLGVGGQNIVSESTYEAAGSRERYQWREWPGRRIKSFDEPETVWELLWDGQSRGEPGARRLPDWYMGERNRYIPRPALEEAVFQNFAELRLDGSTPRLVTLHAEGGMGKTRLAIACAVRAAGQFKDGIFFVRLEDLPKSGQAVAEAIGAALGRISEAAQPERLIHDLRDKEMLLLLDNYESVACNEARAFLAELLTATRGLRLLVTGREAVKLSDVEQVLPLDEGMTEPEAEALFIARARLKRPKWQPSDGERASLRRVLRLTERIPLGVELTAAWMDKRTLGEIAEGIEGRPLGALTGEQARSGRTTHTDRHQSLTRCLDWSFEMLEVAAQEDFACVGLFADSFSPEAVAAVCGCDDAHALLDRLRDAALIRRIEVAGRSRYTLHRFTRAYAADKLASLTTAVAVRQRYVVYFRRVVADNDDTNNLAKLAVLDAEWRNGTAAAELAEGLKDFESVERLSAYLGAYLMLRGLWLERERLDRCALSAARAAGNRPAEGWALNNLGIVYELQDRWAEAEAAYRDSLAICREYGDRPTEGRALNNLGNVYRAQGRWAEAEEAYRQDLAICREYSDRLGEGRTLENLALLRQAQGDLVGALEVEREALRVLETSEDERAKAKSRALVAKWEQEGQPGAEPASG